MLRPVVDGDLGTEFAERVEVLFPAGVAFGVKVQLLWRGLISQVMVLRA